MIANNIYADITFEWKPITIFAKTKEKSYDLFVNPLIRDQLVEFYFIEFQCEQDRKTNSYIDHGINTLNKDEFKQFREDLRSGHEIL